MSVSTTAQIVMKEDGNEGNQQHEEGFFFFLCVAINDRRTLKGKVSPVQRECAYMGHLLS